MDNDKKDLDELFQYGNRILAKLKDSSEKKNDELEALTRRHKELRQNLKNILEAQDGYEIQ